MSLQDGSNFMNPLMKASNASSTCKFLLLDNLRSPVSSDAF